MEIEVLTDRELGARLTVLATDCEAMDWAVAWAQPNEVGAAALRHQRKFRRFVIGTHFYQTSPDFLTRFEHLPAARMMLPTGATFHPKVYLFALPGGRMAAAVGSHNLTAAAFTRNIEASVLFAGDATDKAFVRLQAFVDRQWRSAVDISEHLFAYRVQHAANKDKRTALESFQPMPRPTRQEISPMVWNWDEFVRRVRAPAALNLRDRLRVLEGAQALFDRNRSLRAMSVPERKAITGTFHKLEPKLDGMPWAWFGSMVGHGDLRFLVNQQPAGLSVALDQIPFTGEVTLADYRRFETRFRRAFHAASRGGRYPSATRMLAMKRPDYFVGVNSRNVHGLAAALGFGPTTLTLDNYWERVTAPIMLSPWWQARAPIRGQERQIWDGRAALLDAVFYRPLPTDEP